MVVEVDEEIIDELNDVTIEVVVVEAVPLVDGCVVELTEEAVLVAEVSDATFGN